MPNIHLGNILIRFFRIQTLKVLKLFNTNKVLRTLFRIENGIYYLESQVSIEYGMGLHPKHRLTNYHGFFTSRIQEGERVLDIGCGIGALAYDIAFDSKAFVLGIDIKPENISIATQKFSHPHIQYQVGNVFNELPKQVFDVIVLSNVLEHLSDRSHFLCDILNHTQCKRLLIRVPLYERDWRVPLKRELGIEWRLDPTHQIEYTLETFQDEMNASHLVIQYIEIRWGEIWAETVPLELSTEKR
jgi:2-polyprenyl-3-methyl-5-hydroxy-6-metoxy-1,4-benzoquinol methylase